MSHLTPYYIAIVREHAEAGNPVCEHNGDSYVVGNQRDGFELFKNKELQGKFADVETALLHLDIVGERAAVYPVGKA